MSIQGNKRNNWRSLINAQEAKKNKTIPAALYIARSNIEFFGSFVCFPESRIKGFFFIYVYYCYKRYDENAYLDFVVVVGITCRF